MIKAKKERKKFLPLPEGIEVGGLVRYYRRGWHIGHLRQVQGNKVAVMPIGYIGTDTQNDNKEKRGKWIPITSIEKVL